jgi:quinol monooxygenase YgiN
MIQIQTEPRKLKEMEQTLLKIMGDARKIKGCLNCYLYMDMKDNNTFCLVQEWESQEDLDWYLDSDLFHVIKGAAGLLSTSHQMIHKVLSETDVQEGI